jgi:broad specificity phosphatase PhoE
MVAPTRLILLRHGEVEERYHRVFGGRIDMELSARGREQAEALARCVRRRTIDAIYCSPMRRARQTMAPLADHCPSAPMVKEELREVDFGAWTGLTWEQVHQQFGIRAFQWLDQVESGAIPQAETGAQVRSRVEPCLRQWVGEHAGQNVVVVCHGGIIRVVLSLLLELPLPVMGSFEIDYASMTQVERHAHKTEVTLLNFTPWRGWI